ncbi:MAG: hypothetical protein JO264_15920 [Acidisphaera sp.]|nr:hypothetical protein [Acidisphaera sp.]
MLGLLTTLVACATARFDYTPDARAPAITSDDAYYLEYCAASQLRLKQPFSPDIEGGAGGHAAFYLAGACRDAGAVYPVLKMCEQYTAGAEQGAGVSMDGNFRNANWVVTPGRSFFYDGGLAPGERLTRSAFARMQGEAEQLGLLDGIAFRPELYASKPAGMSDQDYRYALSVGTDYAIGLARGRYCARIPLSRAQMARIVRFLNAKNALYRGGTRAFDSSVFQDNCVHLPHNALAAADIWSSWPVGMFLPLAILDFPVPKNDFVNLVRRTNDLPLDDLVRLYHDPAARRLVLQYGRLPNEPGALAASYPVHTPNDIFEANVSLIFYDAEPIGPYLNWFDGIFHDPRYTDARANLQHFADLYAVLTAKRRPLSFWDRRVRVRDRPSFAEFYARYYERLAALRLDTVRGLDLHHRGAAVGEGEP